MSITMCVLSLPQAATPTVVAAEGPKKPPGQIIRYNKEFLLRFMEVGSRLGRDPGPAVRG